MRAWDSTSWGALCARRKRCGRSVHPAGGPLPGRVSKGKDVRTAPSPLKVEEVWVEKRRYVLCCLNEDQEARYDEKWVLRTNTTLEAAEVALKYKQLWRVEQLFRMTKSLLATRPIFHKCDETIRGHVFCSFLSLILRKELQDRLQLMPLRLR